MPSADHYATGPVLRRLSILAICLVASSCLASPAWARSPELQLDPESWWRLQGDHYVLYSDADPRIAAANLVQLELFRRLFARLSPGLDLRSPAPVRFVAFRDGRSFAPYKVGREGRGTRILGQFVRHSDAHYLLLDAGTRPAGEYSVALHELTHFLVTHNLPGAPLWLNEGLAEYYATFAFVEEQSVEEPREDDDEGPVLRAVVGRPIQRHLSFLFAAERRSGRWVEQEPLRLESLLEADAPVTGHGPQAVGHFYAASWALTHYLLSGDDDRLDRTAAFLALLAEGEEAEDAFEDAFDERLESLEEEVRRHLLELLREEGRWDADGRLLERYGVGLRITPETVKRIDAEPAKPADVLTHLGDFVLHVGAVDYAEGHYDAALAADPRHSAAHVGLASVYDHRGFWHQAELLYRDARKLGIERAEPPVAALAYLRYGRHSLELPRGIPRSGEAAGRGALEDGAVARARFALERAVEIDPHYATAHQLLAAAHLLPGGDGKRGLRAAMAAVDLLPLAIEPRLLEARSRLALGQLERAEALIEGEIGDRADPGTVQTLREEVELQRLVQGAEAAFAAGEEERGLELLDRAVSAAPDGERRRRLQAELSRRTSQ